MATAKFKISDLTDNITSDLLVSNPENYDLIVNDLSGSSAETKKIGLDTLKSGLFGTTSNPAGDFVVVGNIKCTNPEGVPDTSRNLPPAGVIISFDYHLDVTSYTSLPEYNNSDRENGWPTGYTFGGGMDDSPGVGETASDTGMFWDGDDRVYLNTGNKPGLLVARRNRPTTGVQGDLIENPGGYDIGGNHVGINIENPQEKLHIVGNLRVDNDTESDGGAFTQSTGVILAREFFVNIATYTAPPEPGVTSTVVPGYSFSTLVAGDIGGPGNPSPGEGANDTGMYWDGDDRLLINAGNKRGLVVARRERATGDQGTRGDELADPQDTRVGVGDVTNPREKLHVNGNVRIDNGNLIMESPNGSYWNITVTDAGALEVTAAGNLDDPESADAAYEASVAAGGVVYDETQM